MLKGKKYLSLVSLNNDVQKGKSHLSVLTCVLTGTSTFSFMLLIYKCVVMKLKGAQIHCSHPHICTKQSNTSPTAAALKVIMTQGERNSHSSHLLLLPPPITQVSGTC